MQFKTIVKRDGSKEDFMEDKISYAIAKAGKETGEFGEEEAKEVTEKVLKVIDSTHQHQDLTVEKIQDYVEEVLLNSSFKKTAKAYIIYREKRSQMRKRNIFKHRLYLKPYEYPELEEYKSAIQHSYWLHTEFNYTSDIHDYKVNVTESERNALKNAMLAIAQVEVAVKAFWGDLHNRLPKPEIGAVGTSFSESEVRHHDAYSHLLEILGLNDEFKKIQDIPALSQRVDYLTHVAKYAKTDDNRDFTLSILLFSLFIEHVSLFSQFLIIMAFNKYKNLFKGMSNVIEATSKEEQIHGLFGIDIVNTIRDERPEWFDEDMATRVYDICRTSYESEEKVIDWIYENGDLDFLPKELVKEFVKNRLNSSLSSVGYNPIFDVNEEMLQETDWFDDEIASTKHVDFFVKRSVNYSKRTKSITADDLF
ncbi:ribonucleotide-diphosphate reductase subunit beta [Rossellomorea marisflavi]|uniref:ribonucleotide-diphosphate reductase subunit beta n=1 Tax=Rossellomorea marisflavi TaxID=189381 RepID=UPI0025AED77E|nr:ribonucleotide-diphosphate reductase subunit beta [Rossellomorea marisflavi]WJV20834.1 ribonucleotide-diphosphate reductase subunit beta [Rossellomorea marisflavi]